MGSFHEEVKSIQLETTSRCNLNCLTCLKPAYKNSWQDRDMGQDLFDHILTQLPPGVSVHLQGWGEPLLHQDLFDHVAKLKALGQTVSATTNGTVMDESLAAALVYSGLDGLTFSMAGGTDATQDFLRGAESLFHLRRAIRIFIAARESANRRLPRVAVSYLLTPESVPELPDAISWCRKNGVDVLVTVHLTQAGCLQQQKLQFMLSKKQARRYTFLRIRTQLRTLFSPMRLIVKEFHATLTAMCDKNPLSSLFINAAGDVSPCVFLNPPIPEGVTWYHSGRVENQSSLIFGNVYDTSLSQIWQNSEYQEFRGTYRERKEYHDQKLAGIGCSLADSARLDSAVKSIQQYLSSHPAPEQCRLCAKLEGY